MQGRLGRFDLTSHEGSFLLGTKHVVVHFLPAGQVIGEDGVDVGKFQGVVSLDDCFRGAPSRKARIKPSRPAPSGTITSPLLLDQRRHGNMRPA